MNFIIVFFLITIANLCTAKNPFEIPKIVPFDGQVNFISVCDTEHYPWLLIMLNSIKEHTQGKKIQVIVYDIGLKTDEIKAIESKFPAKVLPIEPVHPDLTKKFVVRKNGRLARGWYAWKPVAIKQAFDHFPYFIYIDAGLTLVGPPDNIFHVILDQGYFFFDCGHEIGPMTTQKVKNKFKLDTPSKKMILDQFGLSAGLQGLSKKVYDDYVLPMYQLACEFHWFEDDGTAPWGFGGCRHDQPLFSILARQNNYTIQKVNGDGPDYLMVKGKKIAFHRSMYFQFKSFEANPAAQENNLI